MTDGESKGVCNVQDKVNQQESEKDEVNCQNLGKS